nr:glycosyl hydrolase family 18 protein [Vibrio stylophorae]
MAIGGLMVAGSMSGVANAAPTHDKQVIGYITQWEAWKGTSHGFSAKGEATHLNVDMDKYTILNFSFFGVAHDGSLHSGDLRNKQIYKPEVQQEPGPLLHPDVYSSWDFHILWGELEYIHQYPTNEPYDAENLAKVQAQGFVPHGSGWLHEPTGVTGQYPLPLKKAGGAPGLIELADQKGVKVMASIGGWSMSKHFAETAKDPVKMENFLKGVDQLMALGFHGIDIDWEYPGAGGMNFQGSPDDYAAFAFMLEKIRERIGPNKMLTACFAAAPSKLEGMDWVRLNNSLDYFNMMTYDLNGGWSAVSGHNAPLYDYPESESPDWNLDALKNYLVSQNVPLNKVTFGAAFYGRGVQTTEATTYLGAPTDKRTVNNEVDGPINSAVDLDNFKLFDGQPNYNYIVKNTAQWTEDWDANAKVPYKTKGKYFLSYDNEQSITDKAQYVVDNDLAGLIVWQVHGDIECKGSMIQHGSKLVECTNLSSPLAGAIDKVFSAAPIEPNDPPVVQPVAAQNVASGTDLAFSVTASDPEGAKLTYTVSKGTITATATGADVVYTAPVTGKDIVETLVVTVSDGKKSTSINVTVNVKGNGINTAPELTVPATATVIGGQAVELAITATDADQDKVTVTASQGVLSTLVNGSATLTFNAPKVTETTVENIVVTATDGTDTVSQTIAVTINVEAAADAWNANTIYNTGDEVSHKGAKYTAKWWTKGEEPGTSDVWAKAYGPGDTAWDATRVYNSGDIAEHGGKQYKAKWWTKGEEPGKAAVWQAL